MRRRLGGLINWAFIISGFAGIIYPAFIDDHPSFTKVIVSLTEPNWSFQFAMRWLSVAIFVSAIYIFTTNRYYKNIPISVISTRVEVTFKTTDGSNVKVDRKQLIRANEPDVTAYFLSTKPTTETGHVPRQSIVASVYCKGANLNNELELFGTDKRGYEIIHNFGRPMPFAWYMTLVPMWILNRDIHSLTGFISNNLVERSNSASFLNEFNVDKAVMQFVAQNYKQHNISVEIHFPEGRVPADLKAIRIKNNGVVSEDFRVGPGSTRSLFMPTLQSETLRITWTPVERGHGISDGLVSASSNRPLKILAGGSVMTGPPREPTS